MSVKGPHGGFKITPTRTAKTTLANIVEVIDETTIYNNCALGLKICSEEKPCPLHFEFVKVRSDLKAMLENTTLKMLAYKPENNEMYLKV